MERRFNKDTWYVWEQNSSPMLLVMTLNPAFKELREYLGSCFMNAIVIFSRDDDKNYQGKWLFRLDEGRALGQKMLDMLLCPSYLDAYTTGLLDAEKRLIAKAKYNGQRNSDRKIATYKVYGKMRE